jgi:hypothetical protein
MSVPRVSSLLTILWSIIILLPVVFTQSPPRTICGTKLHPHDQVKFKEDCSFLTLLVNLNPAHLPDVSGWNKIPVRGSRRSQWSRLNGLCHFSFTADSSLSLETWNTVREDLDAIQRDCVDQQGAGGYRGRVKYDGQGSLSYSLHVHITKLIRGQTKSGSVSSDRTYLPESLF